MLQISSCFFSTIVLASHYLQNHDIFYMFTCITVFSIMYHSNKQTLFQKEYPHFFFVISIIDTTLAHIGFIYLSFQILVRHSNLILFSFAIICLWIRINLTSNPKEALVLHFCLHTLSTIAVHMYLVLWITTKEKGPTFFLV